MICDQEASLLERFVRNQDPEAFALIARHYAGMVYGTCIRITGNEERAADVTQETFFHLVTHARQVNGSLGGWLHRVAVGKSVDQVRCDVARRCREEDYIAQQHETNRWSEISPLVDEALLELDAESREILVRHYLQRETLTDIAVASGVSQPTMSRRAEHALEQLRERLRSKGVLVAAVVFGDLMTNTATAAPAMVLEELGKMTMATSGAAAVGSGGGASGSAFKLTKFIGVVVAVAGLGSWIAWRAFIDENTSTASAQSEALPMGGIALRQRGMGAGGAPFGGAVAPAGQPMSIGGIRMDDTGPNSMATPRRVLAAVAPMLPATGALLDKYTGALDAAQSFIASYEEVCDYSYRMPAMVEPMVGKRFARGQLRADGRRLYLQSYFWGDFNPRLKDLPESTPQYHLRIEADGKLYVHSTSANDPKARGSVYSQPAHREKAVISKDPFSGIHGFLGSEERLDAVLRGANRASIRPTPEKVYGSLCQVIDADTKYGQYAVWIDPAHGYQAAKVSRMATGPHWEGEDAMPVKDRSTGRVDITRFEQIRGIWVPVDARQDTYYATANGQHYRKETSRFKRKIITLNPHHESLGSFADPLLHPANDPELRNGARVRFVGPVQMRGTWRNGKVVSVEGEVLFDGGLRNTNYARIKLTRTNGLLPTADARRESCP